MANKGYLEGRIKAQSKNLLGADLRVSSRFPISETTIGKIENYLKQELIERRTQVSLLSMVSFRYQSEDKSQLVQIKWTESGYPFYGSFKIAGEENKTVFTSDDQVVWIDQSFAELQQLKVGDTISTGGVDFRIAKIVEDDSTRSFGFFNFYPTFYIAKKHLEKTNLVRQGSTAFYNFFYKLNQEEEDLELKKELQELIADSSIRVSLPSDSGNRSTRVFQMLNEYLGLIGIIILFLGGMGALYTSKNFVRKKIFDFGVFRVYGLSKNRLYSYFIFVHLLFALSAFVVSSTFITLVSLLVAKMNILDLKFLFSADIMWGVVLTILTILFLTSLLFSLPTIIQLMKFPLSKLLDEFQENSSESKKFNFLYYGPLFIFFCILSIVISNSVKIGGLFFVATIAFILLFLSVFYLVFNFGVKGRLKWQEKSGKTTFWEFYWLRSFLRFKANRLQFVLLLTLSAAMMNLIFFIEASFLTQIGTNQDKPQYFLFDIQEDQVESLKSRLEKEKIPLLGLSPMVRGRFVSIAGKSVSDIIGEESAFETRDDEQSKRFLNRGINMSYRSGVGTHERISSGSPLPERWEGLSGVPVSLEKRYARRLGVNLGDKLVFDVMGIEVETIVTNFREVDWISFYPNFFIQFPNGVLEEAPQTYLAVLNSLDTEVARQFIQGMAKDFPNVPVINLEHILEKVMKIFTFVSLSLKVMSLLCFLVSIFVILNLVYEKVLLEVRDFSLLKILGVSASRINFIIFGELVFLLLLCFSLALVGSGLFNFLINKFVFYTGYFSIPWILLPVNLIMISLVLIAVGLLVFMIFKHRGVKENLFLS
jgi:putative ABC transport system permease protein